MVWDADFAETGERKSTLHNTEAGSSLQKPFYVCGKELEEDLGCGKAS